MLPTVISFWLFRYAVTSGLAHQRFYGLGFRIWGLGCPRGPPGTSNGGKFGKNHNREVFAGEGKSRPSYRGLQTTTNRVRASIMLNGVMCVGGGGATKPTRGVNDTGTYHDLPRQLDGGEMCTGTL